MLHVNGSRCAGLLIVVFITMGSSLKVLYLCILCVSLLNGHSVEKSCALCLHLRFLQVTFQDAASLLLDTVNESLE